ncbi:chaperonin 10-like protein [Pilobolus umbonatus]|nr:chaperonin 10-like protein [Pilobolus umbonatus]
MSTDTFHGWAVLESGGPLVLTELPLKKFDDDTVEMKVTHCGICGSDVHTMNCHWGATDFPCVTGHEIVGVCTKVGKNVQHIKEGDRIGVGAQSGSCGKCKECKRGEENLCQGTSTYTYNSKYPNGDKAFGGYADKWRGHQRFVFKIPDSMTNEIAATFFCAGVTTYSPFKAHGVKAGSKVGVLGVGGLGHFAIQWARAMGAHVVALSGSERKREDADALGCHEYVNINNKEELEPHMGSFTHIIATYISKDFDWSFYLRLVDTNGFFILVDLPEYPLDGIPAMLLASRQVSLVGSTIGSPAVIEEMLEFAAKHNVKPWITKYPMKDCNQAIKDFKEGKPRYRFVLEN